MGMYSVIYLTRYEIHVQKL